MDETLEHIAADVRACRACDLYHSRSQAVPGQGPADARVIFIGEGPGFHEDQQGVPFVGAAGEFLEELLAMIGLKRREVFIANVIKCRPPGNRDPRPDEIEACSGFLDRQIAPIRPLVIVTLGRFSMARYFPHAKISHIHGQPRKIDGILYYPMYHPAAALHQPSLRPKVEEDMARIPDLMARIDEFPDTPPQEQVTQLHLF